MKRKLSIFLIIFVLFNVFSTLIVSAERDINYDYKDNMWYEGNKVGYPYEMNIKYYSEYYDKTYAAVPMFKSLPTLYYDSELDLFYLHCEDGIRDNVFYGGSGLFGDWGWKYLYINSLKSVTKFEFSKDLQTVVSFDDPNRATDFTKGRYEKLTEFVIGFVPIFDESVPESAKYDFYNLLDDDGWDDYYNNVLISVTPDNNTWRNMNRLRTPPPKNSPFLREDKQNDPNSLISPSPNLYYFTVNIVNKGDEPFTFVMTANEKNYFPGKTSVSMSEASSDIKNFFNVNGNVYITVPGNSTFEYNFNFEEIDHKSTKDTVFGVPKDAPDYSLFINFWSKTPGRVTGENWIKLEEFPGDPSSYGFEDFRSCFSHDFSFKGYWAGGSKKPDNYKNIIKDNPIADLTLDGAYGSVDFDLNPSIDDFKSMIDNSKGYLEFVRYVMANFVPSFFWVIIAAGLTGIVVLRILGR